MFGKQSYESGLDLANGRGRPQRAAKFASLAPRSVQPRFLKTRWLLINGFELCRNVEAGPAQ